MKGMVVFERCILSLLVVLLCTCTGAANLSRGRTGNNRNLGFDAVDRKSSTCDPDSAYKQALTVRGDTKYAPFMAFVKKFGLEGELKKLTRGKALFIPSEMSLNKKFKSMGLVKNYGSYDFNNYKLGPYRRAQFLRWVQVRLVKSRDTFKKLLNERPGLKLGKCQAVEGASLYGPLLEPRRPSNCSKPNFDAFMSATERIAFEGIQEWIGKGYNVLLGNPLVVDKVDPGFAQSPFSIENPQAYTQRDGDNSCVQSVENTISTSSKQLQENSASKLGLEASYAVVAFTGSSDWGTSFESNDVSEAATIVASTNVRVASARLKDTNSLALCSTFKDRVREALQNPTRIKDAIRSIIDQYGTHYLQQVSVGGKAQLVIKTSAQSLTEAKASSSNLASTVSASYGLFSGKVSAETSSSEKSKVYSALKNSKKQLSQSPVYVAVTTSSDGGIDCAQYFNQLNRQTKLAAVEMQLKPIAALFDWSNRALWKELPDDGSIDEDQLTSFGAQFINYVQGCSGGGCASVSDICNPGFYGSVPNCQSCYGGSGPVGSKGNCHPEQTCERSGECLGNVPEKKCKNTITMNGPESVFVKGDTLYSCDGGCELRFEKGTPADGKLVMHKNGMPDSNGYYVDNQVGGGSTVKFSQYPQNLGNLVMTRDDNKKIWGTKNIYYRNGNQPPPDSKFEAVLQDDCNFVIYEYPVGEERRKVWDWVQDFTDGHWCKWVTPPNICDNV